MQLKQVKSIFSLITDFKRFAIVEMIFKGHSKSLVMSLFNRSYVISY